VRSSTRPTRGSTSTRCASSAAASPRCGPPTAGSWSITHYQRLLDYVKPDVTHVFLDGRIVRTGGPELALEVESRGYQWVREATA
jgi:Fe-S cluster assembly ATPase SufC